MSLEEVIEKVKHFYEGRKGKDKGKSKWQLKRTRPHNAYEKENVARQKRFNATR